MNLAEIINNIKIVQVSGKAELKDINSLSIDSRKVNKDSIFFAIKGYKTDGHKYILDVLNSGVAAIVLEDNNVIPDHLFAHTGTIKILVENTRKALADISAVFYNNPTTRLRLVGITGTKGKTTTSNFVKSVLENDKCGLIGTISIFVGDKEIESKLTTPESHDLNALFAEMLSKKCESAVMEVSSHSLELHRVDNLDFDFAILTNLEHDHLDFHKTVENYIDAKKKLFDGLKNEAFAIINSDDINWQKFITDTKAKVFTYGVNEDADFKMSNIYYSLVGTTYSIFWLGKEYLMSTPLIGSFNAYNSCAAFAVGVLAGIKPNIVVKRINDTEQVPGRFEVYNGKNKTVIIDYSHTAESLQQALLAIKYINKENYPVYTVFGCGGDRDKTKRPIMGEVAAKYSNFAIVTTDNPRTEKPEDIINDVVAGIKYNNYKIVVDREDAIKEAILNSEENAIVLVAGKGHESYIEINGIRTHFSDKEKVLQYLNVWKN
ncbi:MAG: UDP-N-acetylmuramoyl-L-alanyl-D-glutamate--2,6-diaminopimelate ligase [bacterium]